MFGGTFADAAVFVVSDLPAILALTAATVSTAARSTVSLGTCFVDVQRPAVEVFAVETVDCRGPFGINTHFDKSKAPSLPGIAVGDDADPINGSVRREHSTERIFGGPEAEITYENILHL
jgi:hypothetical protein